MAGKDHWERVYATKAPTAVSWYAPHLGTSLEIIERFAPDRASRIIDVGAGASTLVDDLLDRGYRHLTVLDISEAAIAEAQRRLGERADVVTWRVADVTSAELPAAAYDLWHDRAVFHFLGDPRARERYVDLVRHAVRPEGHVVVATFGPGGPERCSGLDVVRYDAEGIHAQFGATFEKLEQRVEVHTTPWGTEQEFVYCLCAKHG